MTVLKALPLALVLATACTGAWAQTTKSDHRPIDLKPLLPPVLPPLPPNSTLAPGAVGTNNQSPHSSSLYDSPQASQPAPGFRFSIPTR